MTELTDIGNLTRYTQNMSKSVIDKMFFVDKIDTDLLVDFGCADGALIKSLATLFGNSIRYRGYDINPEMIKMATANTELLANECDIRFTDNLEELVAEQKNHKSALILSSVIHEVYSYCSESDIKKFWSMVSDSGFKYIVVRDMMISSSSYRQSDPLVVARIKQVYDKSKLDLWESLWGSLHENSSLIHFLLSYHYEAFERELKENYLPLSVESFLPLIPKQYTPIYFEHFTLPYIRQKVEKDFNIQLQDRTHIKAIFELTA